MKSLLQKYETVNIRLKTYL